MPVCSSNLHAFARKVLRAVAGSILALAPAAAGAQAGCDAFTDLANPLLTPPPEVTPEANPDHVAEWVYQEFPQHGSTDIKAVSSWAVRISQRSVTEDDANEVLAIEEAIYTTSEGKRVHVIGGLWPMQIIVPYADSIDVAYDLWQDPPLVAMTDDVAALAPCGATGPAIYPRNAAAAHYDDTSLHAKRAIYIKEIRDLGPIALRFSAHYEPAPAKPDLLRRGRELVIWAISDTENYDNVIAYHFRDDGEIRALVGPSGWNTNIGGDRRVLSGNTPHLHTVLWRVLPRVGSDASDTVLKVEYEQQGHAHGIHNEHEVIETLTNETPAIFDPARFTSLRFEDPQLTNDAAPGKPPQLSSYAMTLISDGTPRHRVWSDEDVAVDFDFAVLRARPEEATAQLINSTLQDSIHELMRGAEPIEGEDVAVYALTTIQHLPRAEDFVIHPGAPDYFDEAPRNRTSIRWSGVRLTPRNVYTRVPFSEPTPGVR